MVRSRSMAIHAPTARISIYVSEDFRSGGISCFASRAQLDDAYARHSASCPWFSTARMLYGHVSDSKYNINYIALNYKIKT